MATIQYLRLDSSYDAILVPSSSLVDLEAVAQAIKTRLNLFYGEWWEDLLDGTPMFQAILGTSGSPKNQQAIAVILSSRINGTPYVSTTKNVVTNFESDTREFSYSAQAETAFGTVPVAVTPGDSAIITEG